MDSEKVSPWKRFQDFALRGMSAGLPAPSVSDLHIPRRRNTVSEADHSKSKWRYSSVPSDLGPHGSSKHIRQNRKASGASVSPIPRRASEGFGVLKRAFSKSFASGNQESKSKGSHRAQGEANHKARVDVESLRARLSFDAGSNVEPNSHLQSDKDNTQTPDEGSDALAVGQPDDANADVIEQDVAPYHLSATTPDRCGPRIGAVEVNANAFHLFSCSDTDTQLNCAGVVTYPLECEPSDRTIGVALVLDNSAFSSDHTWNQILATVYILFADKIITENDLVSIVMAQPEEHGTAVLMECGHYSYEMIRATLRAKMPIKLSPAKEYLDIAISRAMQDMLKVKQRVNYPQERFLNIFVLTANIKAVHVEFAPASRIREKLCVFLLPCSPVRWPDSVHPGSSNQGYIKAIVGPNFTNSFSRIKTRRLQEHSDLKGLVRQIRTSSVPQPLKNATVSLTFGYVDSNGEHVMVHDPIAQTELGKIYPGQKLMFSFRTSTNTQFARHIGWSARSSTILTTQHECIYNCLGKLHGKYLYIVVDYDYQLLEGTDMRIHHYHKLGSFCDRDGEFNESRAALFIALAEHLYMENKLSSAGDLLPEGDLLRSYREELVVNLRSLVNETHHAQGSKYPQQNSPARVMRPFLETPRRQRTVTDPIGSAATRRDDESSERSLTRVIPNSPTQFQHWPTPDSYRNGPRPWSAIQVSPLNVRAGRRSGHIFERPGDDDSAIMISPLETDTPIELNQQTGRTSRFSSRNSNRFPRTDSRQTGTISEDAADPCESGSRSGLASPGAGLF